MPNRIPLPQRLPPCSFNPVLILNTFSRLPVYPQTGMLNFARDVPPSGPSIRSWANTYVKSEILPAASSNKWRRPSPRAKPASA